MLDKVKMALRITTDAYNDEGREVFIYTGSNLKSGAFEAFEICK